MGLTCPVCLMVAPNATIYNRHWSDTAEDCRHQRPQLGRQCKDERCNLTFKNKDVLQAHLRESHACQQCHTHFQNDNNLRMHLISHKPVTVQCIHRGRNADIDACDKTFPTYSAMLNHIEMGGCDYGRFGKGHFIDAVTCDLGEDTSPLAAWARDEIDEGQGCHAGFHNDEAPWFCRGCDRNFQHLSGLFQHIETSQHCSAGPGDHDVQIIKLALSACG